MSYSWLVLSWHLSRRCFLIAIPLLLILASATAQTSKPTFRIVALAEAGGIHRPFVDAAKLWLQKLAADRNFAVNYIENTDKIDDEFLSHYQLFIQLNYPPYGWTPKAVTAFEKYIEQGRGGWIGFHHATLLGEFDGTTMWPWFSQFMGGIRFVNYIPKFATATEIVEDPSHPAMKGVAGSFVVDRRNGTSGISRHVRMCMFWRESMNRPIAPTLASRWAAIIL